MKLLLWIGKHSLTMLVLLVMWAFLWALPLRSFCLSETFPSIFSVPFGRDDIWIFYVVSLTPLAIFGLPLYHFHQWYKSRDGNG